MVLDCGEVVVSAIASPGGDLYLTLPYPVADDRGAIGAAGLYGDSFLAGQTGQLMGLAQLNGSVLILRQKIAGVTSSVGPYVQVGTALGWSVIYRRA